jgi:CIC family chloride channel protein
MFRSFRNQIEYLIVLGKDRLTGKQFIFLSSVLVGISAALAVIVLKSFAHWVFVAATYINTTLKLSFMNSLLPIIGILLTVLVVKKVLGGTIDKGTSQILYAVAKKAGIIPKSKCMHRLSPARSPLGLADRPD